MQAGRTTLSTLTAALAAVAVLSGCGVVADMTGNRSEVCAEVQQAFADFGTGIRSLPSTDNAAWGKAATDFASSLDSLAAKSDDAELGRTLKGLAGAWRDASPAIAESGDVAQLSAMLRDQPETIIAACD